MKKFPLAFTLDNHTHVVVNKTGTHTYDFSLTPPGGTTRHFTYNNEQSKAEVDKLLDFEQINAVRTFWLKYDDEE